MSGLADILAMFGRNNQDGSGLIGTGGYGSTPIAGVGSTSFLDGASSGPKMGMAGLGGNTNAEGGGIMNFLMGNPKEGTNGALVPMATAATGLAQSYLGMKQYGLAKDAFKESKRQFQLNFDATKKDYNNKLADRQRSRIQNAGSESRYRSVSEVMNKDGI